MNAHCHVRSGPGYTCDSDSCAKLYGRVFGARWTPSRWLSWRNELIYHHRLGLQPGRRSHDVLGVAV